MQKISFKDKFELTNLVLSKRKIQTRRIEKSLFSLQTKEIKGQCYKFYDNKFREVTDDLGRLDTAAPDRYAVIVRTTDGQLLEFKPQYRMGEVVAVAMSYKSIYERVAAKTWEYAEEYKNKHKDLAGWKNKMFVKPDLMPHAIKITNIRIKRLQDISDEDCLAEGIIEHTAEIMPNYPPYTQYCCGISEVFCDTPRQAFAALIDKINGKGTCDSNPYVWVYDFELVK